MASILLKIYAKLSSVMGWKPRQGIEKALEEIDPFRPGLYIVKFPTGYGKTSIFFSTALSTIIYHTGYGAIYAAPLRSLGDDVYTRWVKLLEEKLGVDREVIDEISGLQHLGSPGSIYLNKNIIFTTFDTLFLHIFKLPPPEIENIRKHLYLGHSDVSRGRIADSIIFLDEPHLSLTDKASLSALFSSIVFLGRAGATIILASATIPQVLEDRIIRIWDKMVSRFISDSEVKVIEVVPAINDESMDRHKIVIEDREFFEETIRKNIRLGTIEEKDIVHKITESCKDKRVMLILNTRKRAIEYYNILKNRCEKIFLLHSMIRKNERLEIENKVRKLSRDKKPFLLVTTQVIEAGFDVSADYMITDPCPASSLIQRAGRVARWRNETSGALDIVIDGETNPYNKYIVEKTVEDIRKKRISIKTPYDAGSILGYKRLIDETTPKKDVDEAFHIIPVILPNILNSPLFGTFYLLKKLSEGEIIRSSKIFALYIREVNDIVPATPTILLKLFNESKVLGALNRKGRFIEFEDLAGLVEECRSVREWGNCIHYVSLINGIQAFVIPYNTYREIAYGEKSGC